MMRNLFSFFLILFLLSLSFARSETPVRKYWIYFIDKDGAETLLHSLKKGADQHFARSIGVTEKAIDRRMKTNPGSDIVTNYDLPVAERYKERIEELGLEISSESRWFNAVSVRADGAQLRAIEALPFVDRVERVVSWRIRPDETARPLSPLPPSLRKGVGRYGMNYGFSLLQNELIRVPEVHDIWVDGTGVFVGMNDNGFRWRRHQAMKGMNVVREYDFIQKDSVTENQAGDGPGQDAHGTITMSALGGYFEGELIGPAFGAAFELAKTEVNGSETQVEEDYWVEGLEWHERNGTDIVSSSLAYNIFDDGNGYRYENGDFDGQHAVTSRAAARAASFGVLVLNSMGNEGNSIGSILAPADADSMIGVGAIKSDRTLAGFSSVGPTNDGRTKPDLCAPGVGVYSATRDTTWSYTYANGTSLSCPLAAGVAALVLSARPELTPLQVRDAMRNTASQAAKPDNRLGWGIVDAWEAVLHNGLVISSRPRVWWTGSETRIMTYVVSKNRVDADGVRLHYSTSTSYQQVAMTLMRAIAGEGEGSGLYTGILPQLPAGTEVRYYISAGDSRENRMSPYDAPSHWFTARIGESFLLGASHLVVTDFVLRQSYPNPVGASITTIGFELPRDSHVKIEIFDLLGRRVALVKDMFERSGIYEEPVDTKILAGGIYIYRVSGDGFSGERKLVVVK